MSKTHVAESQDDLDAQLDQFIKTKKVQPVVQSASEPIDLFSSPEKKKLIPFRQRLINLYNRFRQMAL